MTDKITLSNISPTSSTTTAASVINANNALITTAFDNTFSLDGTSPNQLQNNLDMNSNQILNLPVPATANSPARLVDIIANPTLVLTIPPVGTSGAVVGLLNTGLTFSGNNTFSGTGAYTGTNSFSQPTTFNNSIAVNSNITQVTAGHGVGEVVFQVHDAGMVANDQMLFVLGRDESNYDRATLGFFYAGFNSLNNKGWLGVYATDHTILWDGNGFVGINTGTTALTKRFTVNSTNNFSVDNSGNVLQAGSITNTTSSNFAINAASNQQVVIGCSGGTSSVVISGAGNVLYPAPDNTMSLGNSVARWSSVNAMQVIGYTSIGFPIGAGVGGSVTQNTNKTTAVTLNTPTGQITTNSANIAAGAVASFTLTNSQIAATDILVLNHVSGGTIGKYVFNAQCSGGNAIISITNNTAGGLAETLVLGYVIIKGSTN